MADPVTLRIVAPGLLTTVQDLGRVGHARYGVAPGGALDRAALILGNRLLGNDPGAAGLEITLVGPTIEFRGATVIALTGGDLGAVLNGRKAPMWEPVRVESGDRLSFDRAGAGVGARAYLCLAGGIDVEPVLGGRGTDLIGAFGGWQGRALAAGDELPAGRPEMALEDILRRRLAVAPPVIEPELTARVVLGPQADRFTPAGIAAFLGERFAVTARSNRQGIRLGGPAIEHVRGADLVSEGIAHGAIQVPGDGHPIVLLAARQTVGGYVKIATVAGADRDALGQLRPGDEVQFAEVTVEEARVALLAYRERIGPGAIVQSSPVYRGWTLDSESTAEEIERVARSWDPDGVVRVIEALERAGVTSLAIDVAGLKLEIRRGERGLAPSESSPALSGETCIEAKEEREQVVTAPVLGVLYRRSAPDQPPFVEEGQRVASGQVICVLEVMKSYHEVAAPESGVLTEFLVEDGQFVEYGQAIARIATDGERHDG